MISATTRGCLMGRRRNAKERVTVTTRQICRMTRGRAKSSGLSPWNTPFDVAFIISTVSGDVPLTKVAIFCLKVFISLCVYLCSWQNSWDWDSLEYLLLCLTQGCLYGISTHTTILMRRIYTILIYF